jgi:hypothetical protein
MVTILIEDIRSGVTDHQLAEVRVPLYERPDRFWADGRDVCEALQGGPSRIDGEYDHHGKFCITVSHIGYIQGRRGYTLFAESIASFFCG